MAAENAAHGVTANAILPGLVASAGVLAMPDGDHRGLASSGYPTGRLVDPTEIAAAATFLASPPAASITGQKLVIDGGQTLNGLSVTRSVVRQDPVS